MLYAMDAFRKTFGRLKGAVIGMVHLRALPGTPRNTLRLDEIVRIACTEAEIYQKHNVDGIIVENMHDRPWQLPGQIGPDTVANMAVVTRAIRHHCPSLPVGVQVLSACNKQAMAVAAASGCHFIRAEGFVFSHVGDEGHIDSCAAELLRYRSSLGAQHIHIFTDIKKKHSSHAITSDVSLADTALAAELFLSDGLVVTGTATGRSTDIHHVREAQSASNLPVLVGSGVDTDNVEGYLSASGIIIGSHLKRKGRWYEELDPTRLNHFMRKVQRLRTRTDRAEEAGSAEGEDEDGTEFDEDERLKSRIFKHGE